MRELFRRTITSILDAVYPPVCASCGANGTWWCAACRNAVDRVLRDPCPKCLSTDSAHDRSRCSGTLPFAGVVATGYYHSRPLRSVIGDVKYRGVTAVRDDLAAYLESAYASRSETLPWAHETVLAVQPLPLESARERERGFNQAELIADLVRATWHPNAHVISAVARLSSGMPQATIEDHALRSANVFGQFTVIRPIADAVLLVDDVVTTGSTAADAARALLASGTPRVYVFALALGA